MKTFLLVILAILALGLAKQQPRRSPAPGDINQANADAAKAAAGGGDAIDTIEESSFHNTFIGAQLYDSAGNPIPGGT